MALKLERGSSDGNLTMKAAVYYENGLPSVFRYEDVADPTPGPDQVLIRVEAVSMPIRHRA